VKNEMITVDVAIPSADGKSVAYTVPVPVSAVFNEDYKDYILDGNALAEIDRVKARHMGLLSPEEIKALRFRLGVKQKEISELLQIGEKSWTRWETGREHPSRSINILIRALDDGKIDLNYLRSVRVGNQLSPNMLQFLMSAELGQNQSLSMMVEEDSFCRNTDNSADQKLARAA